MKRIVMALIMAILGASVAQAGTNYPALADYPAPSCVKPDKPTPPGPVTVKVVSAGGAMVQTVTGNKEIKKYNEQVAQYNTALHDYTVCMNDYVTNAQADMDMIRVKVNKAVADGKVPD